MERAHAPDTEGTAWTEEAILSLYERHALWRNHLLVAVLFGIVILCSLASGLWYGFEQPGDANVTGSHPFFIVSSAYQGRVLVAEEKDTMERIIDGAITRSGDPLTVTTLLPKGKVFRVASGTKVSVEGFTFSASRAKKIRILEGEKSGKEGWIYAALLRPDPSIRLAPTGR